MMIHQIGHSSTLAQADTPMVNNLTSDAGADRDFIIPLYLSAMAFSEISERMTSTSSFYYSAKELRQLSHFFDQNDQEYLDSHPEKDLDRIRVEQNMEPTPNETRF